MSYKVEMDNQGVYIDIVDDDNDYVTLQKVGEEYRYRIRGPVAEALHHAMTEKDELLYAIIHTKAMKRFLSKRKREEN